MTDVQTHWEQVYRDKAPEERSWFQNSPQTSLALIERLGLDPNSGIIDVGGGTSHLVDELLARGYERLCVIDISAAAIEQGRTRLGTQGEGKVEWIVGDIRSASLPEGFALWHDRAVFHFLTRAEDRAAYKQNLRATLRPGGYALMATFADDGPERCSGLPVERYSEDALAAEIGNDFKLVDSQRETHWTPGGVEQRFVYVLLQRA